jgi:hypothetical protein
MLAVRHVQEVRMLVTRKSPVTQRENTLEIPVTPEQLLRWQSGELIQKAMPGLTADQREFLMSGMTAEDWKATFG